MEASVVGSFFFLVAAMMLAIFIAFLIVFIIVFAIFLYLEKREARQMKKEWSNAWPQSFH